MQKSEQQVNKVLCIIIFCIGCFMSFLIPNWQTPDELTHLEVISATLKNENISNNIVEDFSSLGVLPYKMENNSKVDFGTLRQLMVKTPSYSRASMLPKGVEFSVIKHLTATIGILIGIFFHLPSFWVLQLGELFALSGYVAIIYFALKYIPVKKYLLFAMAISPMALQQASSINYDALLIPLCFFWISYFLYLKYEASEINNKNILYLIIPLLVVAYIKPPYILLGILIFSLPKEKININLFGFLIDSHSLSKNNILYFASFMILVIIALAYVFRSNMYIQVLYGMAVEWKQAIYLLWQTLKNWGSFLLISSVGNFGWLDLSIGIGATLVIYFIFILTSMISTNKENKLERRDYLIYCLVFVILCYIITISLANHTIKTILFGSESASGTYNIRTALYQIPYIGGLQGRYYLPFIMLPFLMMPTVKSKKISNYLQVLTIILWILVYVYVIVLIVQKFWMII